jgi:hypothetical protein
MFDSTLTAGQQELLAARLSQAIDQLRQRTFSTKQEALAQIDSAINGVLALGNRMTPLARIPAFGPATSGNLNSNFTILNRDCAAIIEQLLDTENDASGLYNSFAAAQNILRQAIRERLVASSARSYREAFINGSQIDTSATTASIDYNAGLAATPLIAETFLKPDTLATHPLTAGSAAAGSSLDHLLDSNPTTSFVWNGDVLDLVIGFAKPVIVNTLKVELIGYQGLAVDRFTVTADGISVDDLLAELPEDVRSMDGDSSKFSGDWYTLFAPRHVTQMRLTIRDIVGTGRVEIRNLILSQRKYDSTGQLSSKKITTPTGLVRFTAAGRTAANLTSITHQVSKDGQSYTILQPGDILNVPGPYWYRANLARLDGNFSKASPLQNQGSVLNYTIANFTSTDLGGGIVSRKAVFAVVTGVVDLGETPTPGSVSVYSGATLLAPSAYTISGTTVTFTQSYSNLTLNYQASSYGLAGLVARKNFYSPYLDDVSFEGA